jgi:ankyrin repeat protein
MVPGIRVGTLASPAAQPSESERALHSAAHGGDLPRLRALLEAGVSVHAPDERGCTPLIIASAAGQVAAMRELVQAGAAPDGRDAGKLRWTPLMHALHADRPAAAAALLEWGADPSSCDDSGYSALMMAASRGNRELVEALLARGADVSAELFLGFTALDYAIGYGHAEIVRLLLDAAPHLRGRRNAARRAVLALADSAGDEEILQLLA